MRVRSLLGKCVLQLGQAGIDVASIKGPITESRWYDREGERPCSDVDLWLSPHQFDRAGMLSRSSSRITRGPGSSGTWRGRAWSRP